MPTQPPNLSEDAALSLTMAIVTSSPGPLLLLDGDLRIVAASTSFCKAFDIDPASAPGSILFALGEGEWAIPQLQSLLSAAASGAAKIEAHELELQRPGQATCYLTIHAQRLVYFDLENLRLLMAVTDVTDALPDHTLKEEALQQNLILLQEVRHRVANSLQIIASVLLQSAKRTPSEEIRAQLQDAHNRVMSVAALERQLAGSGDGEVEVHAYFTQLCESIAASMIGGTDQLSLTVTGFGGRVAGRAAVGLGLIVTELVINALKHGFPDGGHGKIVVDCDFRTPNWSLAVTDNGVGMPLDPAELRPGLGTNIVQALAQQLLAVIQVSPAHPGTRVAIAHTQIALVGEPEGSVASLSAIGRSATQSAAGRT